MKTGSSIWQSNKTYQLSNFRILETKQPSTSFGEGIMTKKDWLYKIDKTLNIKYIDYRNIFIWLIYNIYIIYIYTSKIRNKNGNGFL